MRNQLINAIPHLDFGRGLTVHLILDGFVTPEIDASRWDITRALVIPLICKRWDIATFLLAG